MYILIDIGHPGHVHLFKNLIFELKKRGHIVFVTVKDIPTAKKLLKSFNIPYFDIGKKKDSVMGKTFNQLKYNYSTWRLINKYKIQIGLGTSFTLAQVSRLSKMKSVIFDDDDDDVQPYFVKYAHPFCDFLISPDVLKGKRKRENTIYYPGLHELAYLHPARFNPDQSVLDEIGLNQGNDFFVMRFNVFKAHHDVSVKGLSLEQKLQLTNLLKPFGKIFITTERDIEPELKQYQLKISPEKIHSLLYYASLFIGDSQTMTSEAAVLGIPAIRCNTLVGKISYLEEEEHEYGLTYGFTPENFQQLLEKVKELLSMPDLKEKWQKKRQQLLSDKIDSTKFYYWLIENIDNVTSTSFNQNFFKQFK